jgi:hypothetical protein
VQLGRGFQIYVFENGLRARRLSQTTIAAKLPHGVSASGALLLDSDSVAAQNTRENSLRTIVFPTENSSLRPKREDERKIQ